MAITLYSYYRSSCSYRVRIALNLKGLSYNITPVHLIKDGGEQYQRSLTSLNPSQKVPVLVHDGFTVSQSVAIINYLDDVFPERNLLPKNPRERALINQLVEMVNSEIQPLQNLRLLKKLSTDFGASEEQKEEWIKYWISAGFTAFEKILSETSKGRFCFGDSPTAADCFLIPQIYNAHRFNLDMSAYPTMNKINDFCSTIDAFQQAHPDAQPDTPK